MAIEKELKGRGVDTSYKVGSGTDAALQIIETAKKAELTWW
jgi:hypothetical protein